MPPGEQKKEEIKRELRSRIGDPDWQILDMDVRLLKEAGEKNLTSVFKLLFDKTFMQLKEVFDEGSTGAVASQVGHQGVHAANTYEWHGGTIPETETELHERGRALLQLRNIYQTGHNLDAVQYFESIGMKKQAKQLEDMFKEVCGLNDNEIAYLKENPDVYNRSIRGLSRRINSEKMKAFSEQYLQLLQDELERLFVSFPQPLLNTEETDKVVQEIKDRMEELLDQIK